MKLKLSILLGILAVMIILSFLSLFDNTKNNEDVSDYITNLLEIEHPIPQADFVTSEFNDYSGEVPEWVSECMESAPESLGKGEVFAQIDNDEVDIMVQEKINGEFRLEFILESIDPVFGYAVRNNELNWDWQRDTDEGTYVFKIWSGKEPFLYCYLKNEATFFSRLFDENAIYYGVNSKSLDHEYEDEAVRVYDIAVGDTSVKGLSPWGSNIDISGENDRNCITGSTKENQFSCTVDTPFTANERIYIHVTLPNEKEFTIIKIVGDDNDESRYCTLNKGKSDRCRVK